MPSMALRAGPVVGAAANWTVPVPLPLLPLAIVIHDALRYRGNIRCRGPAHPKRLQIPTPLVPGQPAG